MWHNSDEFIFVATWESLSISISIHLMLCLDLRGKLDSRVPRQFCCENKEATKGSITPSVRLLASHCFNKHTLNPLAKANFNPLIIAHNHRYSTRSKVEEKP
jgi:hypothetical protein